MKSRSILRLAAFAGLVALVAAATAAAGTTASNGRSGSAAAQASSTLIDGTTDTVTNIDPAGNYDFGSGTVDYQIFQHLLEAGPGSLTPHPVLATKCGFKGNLKTYSCTLRKNVTFQNGDPFTSADVKWSFDRVIKIKDPSGISSLLANLKSVTVNGKYGVTFHLKNPQSTWPNILTTGAANIVDHSVYPAGKILPNSSQQIGTGPYMLTKFQPGQTAVLQSWSGYWGPKPKTSQVIIRYYSKSSTMKLALEQGDIDMAFRDFTPTEYNSLAKEKGIVVHKGQGAAIRYLVLDTNRAPTDNLAVRQALAYLMPRQTIASRVYDNQVQPLYSMVPKGLPGHVDSFAKVYGKTPSKAKAAKVLKAAGVSTPVNLTLWYTPSHYGDASADEYAEIQRALNASGLFKITLKSAEWAQYVNTLGSTKGAFQLGWFPDYVDAEDYLLPFYASPSNFLQNGYKDPKMDALLKKEQGTKNTAARMKLVEQAQALAAKDVPIIPYWQGAMIAVSHTDVQGIDKTLDPTFIMRFWLLSKS